MVFYWSFSWQQISLDLLDSYQYSGQSQQYCSLNALVLQFPTLSFPILSAPFTSDITITLMFHSFLCSLARSRYLFLFSFSFIFTLWSTGMSNSTTWQNSLYFITRSGLLGRIWWSVCISNPKEFYVSYSSGWILVCAYFIW